MKFMLMMLGTQKNWESLSTWSPAEFKAHIDFMKRFAGNLAAAGELVMAEGLDMPMNAMVVTGKGGPPVITDGACFAGTWIISGYACGAPKPSKSTSSFP